MSGAAGRRRGQGAEGGSWRRGPCALRPRVEVSGWAPIGPSLALERPSRPCEPCCGAIAAPPDPGVLRASVRECELPRRGVGECPSRKQPLRTRSPTATLSKAFGVSLTSSRQVGRV